MTAATQGEVVAGPPAAALPAAALPAGAPRARLWRWEGPQLDPKDNSLNLIRLVLASMVLVAHGYFTAGVGVGPQIDGENLGGWAVFGFFVISGYLITGSRWSTTFGTYLVHRIARIFPAFLVCLVVMTTVFAPISYLRSQGTLAGFLTAGPTPPLNFLFINSLLRVNSYEIAGTPMDVPYPGAWNGSLWTLYYEFLCYLVIGLFALVGWMRRSPWGVGAAWIVSVGVYATMNRVVGPLVAGNVDVILLFRLLPLFLGGALVQLIRHRLPLHWTGAALSASVVLLAIWLLDGWGVHLTAPFLTYLLLWVGSVLPSPALIRRNDISYGVYIYAFPVQQLLAFTGIHERGLVVYDLAALACTVPFATASWLLVERPAMRRARRAHPATPRL